MAHAAAAAEPLCSMNWELSELLLLQDDAKESLELRWSKLLVGSCGIGSTEAVAAAVVAPSNNWDGLSEYVVSAAAALLAVVDGACSRSAALRAYSAGKRRSSRPVMRCWWQHSTVHTRRTVLMAHLLLECRDCTRGSAVGRNLMTERR